MRYTCRLSRPGVVHREPAADERADDHHDGAGVVGQGAGAARDRVLRGRGGQGHVAARRGHVVRGVGQAGGGRCHQGRQHGDQKPGQPQPFALPQSCYEHRAQVQGQQHPDGDGGRQRQAGQVAGHQHIDQPQARGERNQRVFGRHSFELRLRHRRRGELGELGGAEVGVQHGGLSMQVVLCILRAPAAGRSWPQAAHP